MPLSIAGSPAVPAGTKQTPATDPAERFPEGGQALRAAARLPPPIARPHLVLEQNCAKRKNGRERAARHRSGLDWTPGFRISMSHLWQ